MMDKNKIHVFYACDENFLKFTMVSIQSLKDNASKDFEYHIHILHSNISKKSQASTLALSDSAFEISFDDVSDYLKSIEYKLHTRDYYSKTTYYRLFISEMFPELDKALYIDSDTIVLGDVSELYNYDLKDNLVGACNEQAMVQVDTYGKYVEQCVGVDRNHFFNAGVLLINCVQFREQKVLEQFVKLLHEYKFIVTQDEDYLNVICAGKVLWVDNRWNVEMFGNILFPPEEFKIIHYIMVSKPWHYKDCIHKEFFWKYAEELPVYGDILSVLENYTDEEKQRDAASIENLLKTAEAETAREDNFLQRRKLYEKRLSEKPAEEKSSGIPKAKDRLRILEKIREYEKAGRFSEDVEDDLPGRPIRPGEVDYQQKKLSSKIKSYFAFKAARRFLKDKIKSKELIIKGIEGRENLERIGGGTLITCNHFNAFDSFAIQYVYDEIYKLKKHGKFFRIINEANYTTFPGFYGYLMKNCNTLPLSSSHRTMNEFLQAVKALLAKGNYILIYPEQSLWWNYRKPKPMRKGAFSIAAKNNVPILPVFITMQDSDIVGADGFFVQEYTIHICQPIFPKAEFTTKENVEYMMNENYSSWQKVYEDTYKIPLMYC